MSLISRILVVGIAGLALLLVVAIKGLDWAADRVAQQNTDTYLAAYADILVPAIEIDAGVARVGSSAAIIAAIPRDWQISQAGTPQQRSNTLKSWVPVQPPASADIRFRFNDSDGREILALQKDYLFPKQIAVTVTFGIDAILADNYSHQQRAALSEELKPLFYGAAVIAALLMLCLVSIVLWPLKKLRADIGALGRDPAHQLSDQYPKELRALTRMLNTQRRRHESSLKRYRQFASNLSHAIKTPLTSLRLQSTSEAARANLDAIDAIVDRNLARVRIAGPAAGGSSRVDVGSLLQALARSYRKITGVTIGVQLDTELTFDGDSQDFVEAVGNVLENGCRYARSSVELSAGAGRIIVADDGPGLPANRFDEVLKRGTRLDQSDTGSGIGLSIADEIAHSYGGRVELGNRAQGGLKVTIAIPSIRAA